MATSGTTPTPSDRANELKTLVVDYARQETVDPLRTLGRFLGFGVAGSMCLSVGLSLLLMALLRGLQTIDTFNDPTGVSGGRWSWAPYLITVAAGTVVVGLAAAASKKKEERR